MNAANDWTPDDGCQPGLSTSGYFWAAGPAAYWGVYSGGWNNCHMGTGTNSTGVVNWAEWYLPTSPSYDGQYTLNAYVSGAGPVPYTHQAVYRGWCCGHSGGITFTELLDQHAWEVFV